MQVKGEREAPLGPAPGSLGAGGPLRSAPLPDLAEAELNEGFMVLFSTCHSKKSNSKMLGGPLALQPSPQLGREADLGLASGMS